MSPPPTHLGPAAETRSPRSTASPRPQQTPAPVFPSSCSPQTPEETVLSPSFPSSRKNSISRAWESTPTRGAQMASLRELRSVRVPSLHPTSSHSLPRLPYAPSHLLPLASLTAPTPTTAFSGPSRSSTLSNAHAPTSNAPPVRNVVDIVFLPGFNEPTLALLYAPEPTWTGRLENMSNNCLVSLVTLAPTSSSSKSSDASSSTTTAVVIATSPSLPHSCLSLHPCPPDLGGTLILTANGLLHLEQGSKVIGCASNSWFGREWFGPGSSAPSAPTAGTTPSASVREGLEGASLVFVSNAKAIVFTRLGSILELTLEVSGRSVSSMRLKQVGQGVAASCVERIRGSKGRFGENGLVFVGSEVGESTLVRWEIGNEAKGAVVPAPVEDDGMELDDDEGAFLLSDVGGRLTWHRTATRHLWRILGRGGCSAGRRGTRRDRPDKVAHPSHLRHSLDVRWDPKSRNGPRRRRCQLIFGVLVPGGELTRTLRFQSPPELVACTGGGVTAGFTVFAVRPFPSLALWFF